MKITNLILKTALIINFQLLIFNCFAQTNDSLEIHTIKGKQYYIHIVEKGNSLYFIHKKYNIPIDVIKKENPNVTGGLSVGEKIYIPVNRNGDVDEDSNKNFINHIVTNKQTLYGIAKLYDVNQNEIIALNPEVVDGLKEGQVLKIPIKEAQKPKIEIEDKNKSHYHHTVEKGETLYSLSKMYNVSIDSLVKVNGGLKDGLKEGDNILLPVQIFPKNKSLLDEQTEESIDELDVDTIHKKNLYNIGLMLPFYLDENDEITQHREALDEKEIYPKSQFALDFYNGFLYALDSMASDSLKFQLYVYDTKGNDSVSTSNLLLKKEFKTFDFIVGPLYASNFEEVAEFCNQNKIPLVAPVKENNKILLDNAYIYKVVPSETNVIPKIVQLLVDSFKTDNKIVLNYDKSKADGWIDLLKKTYQSAILTTNDSLLFSPLKVIETTNYKSEIFNQLQKDKNNILLLPIRDANYIANLFNYLVTNLNSKQYKNYKITIVGMEEWLQYENIDLEYFQKLNVYLPVTKFVNYNDSCCTKFIDNYINKYNIYPSNNALLGFDIGYYFASAIKKGGSVNYYIRNNNIISGKVIDFNFYKTGLESGYENKSSAILKFENYHLVKIY